MESVNFSGPKIIGYFSVNENQKLSKDFSQLRYLCNNPIGKVELDLAHSVPGIVNDFICENKKLSRLLEYFKLNRDIFDIYNEGSISLEAASFVCSASVLLNIVPSCFWPEQWSVSACLFRGVIYLGLQDEKRIEKENKFPHHIKKRSWWGAKFDQYLLTDNPSNNPNIHTPVELNAGFWNIHETAINDHRIIYCIIKDAIYCTKGSEPLFNSSIVPEKVAIKKLENAKFISLKTAALEKNIIKNRNVKSLKWWLHSQLSGVDTVFCGLRPNKIGLVTIIKQYSKNDIQELDHQWDPNTAMKSWDSFLSFVKKCFSEQIQKQGFKDTGNIRNLPLMEMIFEGKSKGNFRSVQIPAQDYVPILPQSYVQSFPAV